MASIIENLQKILSARYGRDVRNAIHDSISDLNEIANTAQTSAKAYYEGTQALAQTISGNVGIDDSSASLGTTYSSHKIENKTRTNLLNSTIGTTTINGITCTTNNDGTYTLSGTANAQGAAIAFGNIPMLEDGKTYKLCGTPSGGAYNTYRTDVVSTRTSDSRRTIVASEATGKTFDAESGYSYEVRAYISPNTTLPNLTFKPMLTTDLSASYDDFVSYSGNGELNANVAEMYKTIETLKNAITELGGTV